MAAIHDIVTEPLKGTAQGAVAGGAALGSAGAIVGGAVGAVAAPVGVVAGGFSGFLLAASAMVAGTIASYGLAPAAVAIATIAASFFMPVWIPIAVFIGAPLALGAIAGAALGGTATVGTGAIAGGLSGASWGVQGGGLLGLIAGTFKGIAGFTEGVLHKVTGPRGDSPEVQDLRNLSAMTDAQLQAIYAAQQQEALNQSLAKQQERAQTAATVANPDAKDTNAAKVVAAAAVTEQTPATASR